MHQQAAIQPARLFQRDTDSTGKPLHPLSFFANTFGTDKLTHGYIPFYEKELPDNVRSMLEIGIAEGKSALMWTEYFGRDNLDFHVLDLFQNPDYASPKWARNRGMVPHIGSQADREVLGSIRDKFQVIIDDGSHNAAHQWKSFVHLFWHNLLPGGKYIIEDCHCNEEKFYWGEGVIMYEETPQYVFGQMEKHSPQYEFPYLANFYSNVIPDRVEWNFVINLIKSVKVVCNKKLIIIEKK